MVLDCPAVCRTDPQVYYHFQRPRRDSRLERLGLIYLCFMCLVHLVMCNYQTSRIVSYSDQFTAVIFIDFVRAPTLTHISVRGADCSGCSASARSSRR